MKNTYSIALPTLLSQQACVALHIDPYSIFTLEYTAPIDASYTCYHLQYKLT